MSPAELYLAPVRAALPRLLSLLDRNPASPTYGCFDRSYWLHRKTDFPASTAQLSVHTLALLYRVPGTSLHRSPAALRWAEAALRYTLTLQHRDGSFDEWYPNERGWAGPTGYVAHALYSALELLETELPPGLVRKAKEALAAAAYHLRRRDEKDVLANHFAIAVLPLREIADLLGDERLREAAEDWFRRFEELVSPEGWSLEYDGCDLGYALGTLDFFATLHSRFPDDRLLGYARRSFAFLGHMLCPDGSWAGALGSRHTVHFYPFALEYWAGLLPEARPLLAKFRASPGVEPATQEDHYLHYRLAGYLKAAAAPYRDEPAGPLPYETEGFRKASFPEAGFELERRGDFLLWTALKRGGAFRLYEKDSLVALNNGCTLSDGRRRFTSLWQGSEGEATWNGWEVRGRLTPLFTRRFRPASFLLFRFACQLMRLPLLAYLFKRWIRARMITPRNAARTGWRRSVRFDGEALEVVDAIEWREKRPWRELFWGGEFSTRYVPQSCYFQPSDARFLPRAFSPEEFSDPGSFKLRWLMDLRTKEASLCAR